MRIAETSKGDECMKPYLVSSEGSVVNKPVPAGKTEMIRFSCGQCGKFLRAGIKAAGKKSKCPNCEASVVVPVHSKSPKKKDSQPIRESMEKGDGWDSYIWRYYQHYILNIMSNGSPMGINVKYIGFWWRVFQYVIDALPVAAVYFIFAAPFKPSDTSDSFFYPVAGLFCLAFLVIYWAVMESSKFQGSLGKILLEFRVTDEYLEKISFKKALARNIVKTIIFIPPFCLLHLIAGFHKNKQGIHDRISKTVVVVASPEVSSWRHERRWVILWMFLVLPFALYVFLFMK